MIIHLIVGLMKKILLYKMSQFSEPYDHSGKKIKIDLNLLDYGTKLDSKNAAGVDSSKFAN